MTVSEIVLEEPGCGRVLQRHRIDYCCAGSQTLEVACAQRGLSLELVRAELDQARRNRPAGPPIDPRSLSTPTLVALIIGKHHGYLRRGLPAITSLASRVSRAHGYREPKLPLLAAAVVELADRLLLHLDHEEQILFPGLVNGHDRRLELQEMKDEHRIEVGILDRIYEASDKFTAPSWGCVSYRALVMRLSILDADLRQHMHLENHVLIPRFIGEEEETR
jgi:regulator of cell morphogenesis and NO signaling